jgi:hypothetical protein
MKLLDIKNVETLNVTQSLTVKGGGRETRPDQTASTSTYTGSSSGGKK